MSDANGFYRPGPSIQAFHDSSAFVRILIGGRGASKTFAVLTEALRHLWQNAGGKALFLRKTEISQADSTIESMLQYFSELDEDLYSETEDSLFKMWNGGRSVRVPSEQAVKRYASYKRAGLATKGERKAWLESEGTKWCGFIEMRGLPNTGTTQSKLRGFECSFLALVEADQMERSDFALSLACLRWKGADPETCDENGFITDTCVTVDTNPPSPSHWIAKMEEEESAKPENERRMEFWHISTYENEHNLPKDYIANNILLPYAGNEAMIQRMLWGKYADAFSGQPVYYAYSSKSHKCKELGWPRGALLVCGLDVGVMNASCIAAVREDAKKRLHIWLMREIILTGSDTERQAVALLNVLAEEFPWWNQQNDVCPGFLFFCDPAARNSSFTDNRKPTSSALSVLNSHGIMAGYTIGLGLQPSIAVVNRLLQDYHTVEMKNPVTGEMETKTVWHFRISEAGCPSLCNALAGAYRYAEIGENQHGKDEPMKGPVVGGIDHVCFVAGTLIATARGQIPIEHVIAGDLVFTRNGLRPVSATIKRHTTVKDYHFSNGASLTCTPDHPFWNILESEMKPIDLWTPCDTAYPCNQMSKLLSGTGRFIAATLIQSAGAIASISSAIRRICTIPFGRNPTDRDRKECMSITRMKTPETIRWETSCSSRQSSTLEIFTLRQNGALLPQSAAPPSDRSQRNGTHPRREGNGTWSMPQGEGSENSSNPQRCATNVERISSSGGPLEPKSMRDSALTIANLRGVAHLMWMTWIAFAGFAQRFFVSIAIPVRSAVRAPAVENSERAEEVINISVEGDHEYFANGILVSNCDAFRYLVNNIMSIDFVHYDTEHRANNAEPYNPEKSRSI